MFSLLTKEQKDKRFNNKVKTGCFYRFYFLTINSICSSVLMSKNICS